MSQAKVCAGSEALPVAEGSVRQTSDAFGFKWAKRETYESDAVREKARNWLIERYLGGDPAVLDRWLSGSGRFVLDAGCGAGFSAELLFGERLNAHDYLGLDFSEAVHVARERFSQAGIKGRFVRADLLHPPVAPGCADVIFSEGVLHHTGDTRRALVTMSGLLKPGGLMLFYVYAKKSVVREYTDDHIRNRLKDMTNEEAWEALRPLTRLGKVLGDLDVEVDVPEDIPLLGVKAGKMDLQRFMYWNIVKLFYDRSWSIEEMLHVNFDWFRPLHCQRQTPEEVECWCREAGLSIERMDVQEAGITVVAVKTSGSEAGGGGA